MSHNSKIPKKKGNESWVGGCGTRALTKKGKDNRSRSIMSPKNLSHKEKARVGQRRRPVESCVSFSLGACVRLWQVLGEAHEREVASDELDFLERERERNSQTQRKAQDKRFLRSLCRFVHLFSLNSSSNGLPAHAVAVTFGEIP